MEGYDFTPADLPALLRVGVIPEQPRPESRVILDWLTAHGAEYDRWSFSVRLGTPIEPNPDHLPGVQKSTVFSSLKRIDVVAWRGTQATIIESKVRVSPDALGKVLMYRQLFLEEQPDASEPRLVIIGRYGDEDTLRSIGAHGIDVYLYDTPAAQ